VDEDLDHDDDLVYRIFDMVEFVGVARGGIGYQLADGAHQWPMPFEIEESERVVTDPSFYRRQAADMLKKAEQLEQLGILLMLSPGDVVMFRRDVGTAGTLSYAAILVQESLTVAGVPVIYWYLTGSGRSHVDKMVPGDFVRWLADHNTSNVQVVTATRSIAVQAEIGTASTQQLKHLDRPSRAASLARHPSRNKGVIPVIEETDQPWLGDESPTAADES
jgi:hypothetical protein